MPKLQVDGFKPLPDTSPATVGAVQAKLVMSVLVEAAAHLAELSRSEGTADGHMAALFRTIRDARSAIMEDIERVDVALAIAEERLLP